MRTLLDSIQGATPRKNSGGKHSLNERLILKYAMRHFSRCGYSGCSIRTIARDAGVAAPMINYYFDSKEKLYLKVCEIVMASLNTVVQEAAEAHTGLVDSLKGIMNAVSDLWEHSPDAMSFIFGMVYGPTEGRPVPDLTQMFAVSMQSVKNVFERAVASGELVLRDGITISFLAFQFFGLASHYLLTRFRANALTSLGNHICGYSVDMTIAQFLFSIGEITTQRSATIHTLCAEGITAGHTNGTATQFIAPEPVRITVPELVREKKNGSPHKDYAEAVQHSPMESAYDTLG